MNRITEFARTRSEDEWRAYAGEQMRHLRHSIRDNGEKAAVLGFALGIFIVVFFKLFVVLLMLSVAAYCTVLILADSK